MSSCAGSCSTSCPRAYTRSATSGFGTIAGASRRPASAFCYSSRLRHPRALPRRSGPQPTRPPTASGPRPVTSVHAADKDTLSASAMCHPSRRADHEFQGRPYAAQQRRASARAQPGLALRSVRCHRGHMRRTSNALTRTYVPLSQPRSTRIHSPGGAGTVTRYAPLKLPSRVARSKIP